MSPPPGNRLVADIGGTNSRLGLYDPTRDEMRSLLTWLDPAASPRITIGVGEPGLLKSG